VRAAAPGPPGRAAPGRNPACAACRRAAAAVALQVSAIVAFVVLRQRFAKDSFDSEIVYLLIFEALDVFVCISVAALAIAQASQVARNVTTNELANWHRCGAPAAPPALLCPPGARMRWVRAGCRMRRALGRERAGPATRAPATRPAAR
jgi:hypothetical protein